MLRWSILQYFRPALRYHMAFRPLLSPRFFKKCPGYCNRLRPSVTLSPPKPLDEITPNLMCELLTCMGHATALFFCPDLWGPGEGSKGKISLNIIKFQIQSQFQRFLNQILCDFSQMKDFKHIRRDFHLAAWVMR